MPRGRVCDIIGCSFLFLFFVCEWFGVEGFSFLCKGRIFGVNCNCSLIFSDSGFSVIHFSRKIA